MNDTQLLLALSIALFTLGLAGVIIRRNALVMLMCIELMLNAVVLSLVTFAARGAGGAGGAGAVLALLVFVVAAAEIAIAIPIVLLLARQRRTLDVGAYRSLKG
jgi:NADH-quinone oxidoreductase subunit K